MNDTALTGGPVLVFLAVCALLILKFWTDGNKAKKAPVPVLVKMFSANSILMVGFAVFLLWLLAGGG